MSLRSSTPRSLQILVEMGPVPQKIPSGVFLFLLWEIIICPLIFNLPQIKNHDDRQLIMAGVLLKTSQSISGSAGIFPG